MMRTEEGDVSVPITHAYNHHYFSWLVGGDAELAERDTPTLLPNPTTTRFVTRKGAEHGYPTNIVFKAGPGDTASASKSSIRRFVITEKAPTRAFSWLKAAFTFKNVLRH